MLVDTSIWIEFLSPRSRALRPAQLDELARAIADGEVCTILPIYAELISGAKRDDDELRGLLSALRFVDLDWNDRATWSSVALLGREAHARKMKIPGLVDRMILCAARESAEPIWALDGALRRLARAVGIVTR